MRAWVVTPGKPGSARLQQVPEPDRSEGEILVETLAVGVCGTDREIVDGKYGEAPEGEDFLVLGHESLGRVLEAPTGSSLAAGDLVVAIVRHPDPVPCPSCAAGEWDMCSNGKFTEHGIKRRHGFGRERFRVSEGRVVKLNASMDRVGVLVETASVLAKAWEHIEVIGSRARWAPERVLVTGAGPVGMMAALMAAQRGLEVHVLDRLKDGPKPELVRALGARYHSGRVQDIACEPDVVVECTGAGQVVFDSLAHTRRNGIVCLTGISSAGRRLSIDAGRLNRLLVLENDVVFGSVNANRRHYAAAVAALEKADRAWLERLITRCVPLSDWSAAFEMRPGDVKTVIEPQGAA